MEEKRWDDSVMLTDQVTKSLLADALKDPKNKAVAIHKPGSRVKMSDGTEYEVQPNGAWLRVSENSPQ